MSDCNTCTHLIHQKYGVKCEKNLLAEGIAKTPCKGYEKAWNYCKPPLGAPPAYIRCEARIKELADAISRASDEGRNYPGHIMIWAKEIIWQCEIMEKARSEETQNEADPHIR